MTEASGTASVSPDDRLIECFQSLASSVAALAEAVRADSPAELMTAEELAERFHIPARTIKDQASAGRLPHHRFGKHYRFAKDDVVEILRQTKHQPLRRTGRGRTIQAA